MKTTNILRYSLLALVILLLFCSCHKEEEPTDYRDKWVGEYSSFHDLHTGAPPLQMFISVEKVKGLDSALYFHCYGDCNAKFVSNVDFYGKFSSYAKYFGSFYTEDSIVIIRHIDYPTFAEEYKFSGKKIK